MKVINVVFYMVLAIVLSNYLGFEKVMYSFICIGVMGLFFEVVSYNGKW